MKITPLRLAWLAGLLEGEGAFMVAPKFTKRGEEYPTFRIACNMCDRDVLRRVFRYAGVGKFAGPTVPTNPKHRPFWRWAVHRRKDVFDLLTKLYPLMGARRRGQFKRVFAAYRATIRTPTPHGVRYKYELGCRCAACRATHNKRMRDQRAKRGGV